MSEIPISLTPGYEYTTAAADVEVAQLLRQVDMGKHVSDTYMQERRAMVAAERIDFIDVGVRDGRDALVGFGSVAYSGSEGELCDFVVSPWHQRRGIGKAIIDERLRRAEAAGIASLYIPTLEKTNTLSSYYREKGFVFTGAGMIIRDQARSVRIK